MQQAIFDSIKTVAKEYIDYEKARQIKLGDKITRTFPRDESTIELYIENLEQQFGVGISLDINENTNFETLVDYINELTLERV